jgi:adenylate cyclase
VWAWVATANLVGAVLIYVFFDRIAPAAPSHPARADSHRLVSTIVFVAFLLLSVPVADQVSRRAVERHYRWLDESRGPNRTELEVALKEPLRMALLAASAWAAAAVAFGVLQVAFGNEAIVTVRIVVGIVFGGLGTCMVTFLLVEWVMRPVFAEALANDPPRRDRYLGVRPRLMLSWALGSGVPLLGITLATVGPGRAEDPRAAVAFLSVVGVLAGWLSMFVAARSVADPIESVRSAVGRVEQGDLDVEVTVNDGGEVGLLQAGFNKMVAGLRERQRLRDLFGRHVGDEVARQALERGTGLSGEQREASALFVDLIGSTKLAAERPATEVVGTLNALFDAVVRAVADEGGWVNKFEGDGALCVFGAPMDQPDHAARALRAAVALHDELARQRRAAPGRAALDVGIGVSSGTVVAGNVGTEARYEYTVIGDPVNEAARLTDLAKEHPARLLASEPAVRAAGSEAGDWVVVGEFDLRGRGRPTCAYAPRTPALTAQS